MTGGRVERMRMLYLVGSLDVLPRDPLQHPINVPLPRPFRTCRSICGSTRPPGPPPGPLTMSSAVLASATVPHLELFQPHYNGPYHILLHLLSARSHRRKNKNKNRIEFLPVSPWMLSYILSTIWELSRHSVELVRFRTMQDSFFLSFSTASRPTSPSLVSSE
jgi:hypothetical protein